MTVVGRIAIVSNAMIIAFSSNFIPRLVYMLKVNSDHTDQGFLEFSLAYFNTTDFKPGAYVFENYFLCNRITSFDMSSNFSFLIKLQILQSFFY